MNGIELIEYIERRGLQNFEFVISNGYYAKKDEDYDPSEFDETNISINYTTSTVKIEIEP